MTETITAVDATTTEKPKIRKTTILYFSKGPILVLAVIFSLLLPYIQEYCTPNLLIHLAIGSLGIFWMLRDLSTILESTTRSGLNLVLDSIVLDDVLKAIYDPIEGLWACCVGTYLGASSMYGLGMDKGQRTELVQSSLGLRDETQAHSVLLEPGGCKSLFPPEVQNWLRSSQMENSVRLPVAKRNNVIDSSWSEEVLENNKSACDSDILFDIDSQETLLSEESSSDMDEQRNSLRHETLDSFEDEPIGRSSQQPNKSSQTQGGSSTEWMKQADPVTVFFRILQDMARNKLKTCAEGLDRSKIETVGIAAVAALGIQLALLRSSKKPYILKLCASVATLSFGTVLSREALLGNVYDKQTLQVFGRDLAARIVDKVKEKSASYKSVLAMLVLIVSCRRKQVARGLYTKNAFAH